MLQNSRRVMTTREIAQVLSEGGAPIDARTVRRRLMKSGALEKVGGRWVTSRAKLWEHATPYAREMAMGFGGEDREL